MMNDWMREDESGLGFVARSVLMRLVGVEEEGSTDGRRLCVIRSASTSPPVETSQL